MTFDIWVQDQQIIIDKLNINYKIAGKGRCILILHGWGSSSERWQETAKILSQAGFKVVVPDLPCFGKSVEPPFGWSVGDYAEFVLKFAKELNLDKFFLIGHSFGGRIAIKLGAVYPEKIQGLILVGAAGIESARGFKSKIFLFLAKLGNSLFSLPLLKKLYPRARKTIYLLARTKDYFEAEGVRKEIFKKVISEDLTTFLSQIKTPTLLIWGKKDRLTPLKHGYLMKEKIPNSTLEVIPNFGHALNLECPQKLATAIIKWLKTL